MLRAAIAAETVGIPSVSIVCEGFVGQAAASARGHGFDDLALAEIPGHVDAMRWEELRATFLEVTVPQIVGGLTTFDEATTATAVEEPGSLEIVRVGRLDDIQDHFVRQGWSDGLPIVPPTRDRVEAMLLPGGHDPWKILGIAPTSGRDISVWSLAVNAVMAGCRPEHFPVVLAIAHALADPRYGAQHSGNTTGADALVILDSDRAADLGFRSGAGALRDGARANTAVGRWLRLYLRNVFGFTSDAHDKATFGNSFRVVLAEDLDTLTAIGWPTVAAELGVNGDGIAMARYNSGAIIGSVFGATPEEVLPYLGDGLARVSGWDLTHVYGLGQGHYRPLLVLSPILARLFADAGWSKADVARGLFEHARIPAWRFEKLIGEWSNLTPGRRSLIELARHGHVPTVFAESDDPDRLVPIVTEPSKLVLAVAGDSTRANAFAFSHDGPHGDLIAKPIDFEPVDDLICLTP